MRDYSFGNFLHELRVRRVQQSRFKMGKRIGRAQSRILYKLGEVLGVTVDELLACKHRSTENKNIKRVFAMKKALWNKASETLTSLYGSVPPIMIFRYRRICIKQQRK